MDYNVIKASGSQYCVTKGSTLVIPKLDVDEGKEVKLEVLFSHKQDEIKVGAPILSGFAIGKVVKHYLGEKIDVIKFKAKSRYRRKMGFRPQLTQLEILSLA